MMTDAPKDPKPVDLKARLGLNKKLANLEAKRSSTTSTPAPTPKTVAEVQQPPRPKRSFPMESVTDVNEAEPSAIKGSSKLLFLGGITVACFLSLSAGYVLGTSFQHRRVSNAKIENAKAANDIIFQQGVADSDVKELLVTLAKLSNDLKEGTVSGPLEARIADTKKVVEKLIEKEIFTVMPDAVASAKAFIAALPDNTAPERLAVLTEAHLKEISNNTSKVGVIRGFLSEAKAFASTALAALKSEDKEAKLIEAHSIFIKKARLYRDLDIRFPIDSIASGSFYFVEIFSFVGSLHSQSVELNALLDSMIQDQLLLELIGEKGPAKSEHPMYEQYFWIDQSKTSKKEPYGLGKRILSLHQKETIDRRKKIKGQAIKLVENPDDPILVPLSEISKVPVGDVTQLLAAAYTDTLKSRLIVTMVKRLNKINEISEAFSTDTLQKKLDDEAGRTPYFVF